MKTNINPHFLAPNRYYEYFYNRKGQKCGILAAEIRGDEYEGYHVGFGYSLCNVKMDKFNPNKGLDIAFARATMNTGMTMFVIPDLFSIEEPDPNAGVPVSRSVTLPQSMAQSFIGFYKRAERKLGKHKRQSILLGRPVNYFCSDEVYLDYRLYRILFDENCYANIKQELDKTTNTYTVSQTEQTKFGAKAIAKLKSLIGL